MQYPEIATAAIGGPEAVGDTMKYCVRPRDRLEGSSTLILGSGSGNFRPWNENSRRIYTNDDDVCRLFVVSCRSPQLVAQLATINGTTRRG